MELYWEQWLVVEIGTVRQENTPKTEAGWEKFKAQRPQATSYDPSWIIYRAPAFFPIWEADSFLWGLSIMCSLGRDGFPAFLELAYFHMLILILIIPRSYSPAPGASLVNPRNSKSVNKVYVNQINPQ